MVWLGPVAASRGTVSTLKALAGASLSVHLLMAGCLLYLLWGRRRARPSPSTEFGGTLEAQD